MLGQFTTHANFSVDDLQKAKSFYVDKLGFKIKRENDYEIMLESGAGTRLNIYLKQDHKPWDATVFGIEVDNVWDSVSELGKLDVKVEKIEGTDEHGVMSQPNYGDVAWLKDPAGNWICISNIK